MNKRKSVSLAALIGYSAMVLAQAPAAPAVPPIKDSVTGEAIPHDVKAKKGKAVRKAGRVHKRRAPPRTSTGK